MSDSKGSTSATDRDQVLVTAIIPTYNRAGFLEEAVESVLGQTYPNLELIVVDDGSTDNTPELMREYQKDSRVRYIQQENKGQNVARNAALAEARGDYIAFLDSDNTWALDRLERQLPYFEGKPELGVVYGRNRPIDEGGHQLQRRGMPRYSGRITGQLLKDNFVTFNTTLIRQECFTLHGGQSEKYTIAPDYDLWLRISTTHEFLFVPEFFGEYRIMADQISSDKMKRYAVNEQILTDFLRDYPNAATATEIAEGWAFFYTRKGERLAKNGRAREALGCYRQALRQRPWSSRTWRALGQLARARFLRRAG